MNNIGNYALLGTYEYGDRNNIEVIATSDKTENLRCIKKAINQVNTKLMEKDRDEPSKEVQNIIENYLSEIDLVDDTTGFVNQINAIGIFKINEVDSEITINCHKCNKILFQGFEKEAKGLVIYCPDCAQEKTE